MRLYIKCCNCHHDLELDSQDVRELSEKDQEQYDINVKKANQLVFEKFKDTYRFPTKPFGKFVCFVCKQDQFVTKKFVTKKDEYTYV